MTLAWENRRRDTVSRCTMPSMTTTLTAIFDGKALIPAGPVDLPKGTALRVQVQIDSDSAAEQATLNLLAAWNVQDTTNDPDELASRRREWERFRTGMNENSLSGRLIYP